MESVTGEIVSTKTSPLYNEERYIKTVTSIIGGESKYEREIKNIIDNNSFKFITGANDGFNVIKIPNRLKKEYRMLYSSFLGTATGILIEFYLAAFKGEKYQNEKVNKVVSENPGIYSRFVKYYDKIHNTSLDEIETLSDIAMEFAAYESYYRSSEEESLKVLKLKDSIYKCENDVYYEIMIDMIQLYKSFIETFVDGGILKQESDIIINPKFDNIYLRGDGDFLIDGTLYELKCLSTTYELENVTQLMLYYFINEMNNKLKDTGYICINSYDIRELKIHNPRYKSILNVSANLKEPAINIAERIVGLIDKNTLLYGRIMIDILDNFSNNKEFKRVDKEKKEFLIDNFFRKNKEYTFVLENKDYYNFRKRLIKSINKSGGSYL